MMKIHTFRLVALLVGFAIFFLFASCYPNKPNGDGSDVASMSAPGSLSARTEIEARPTATIGLLITPNRTRITTPTKILTPASTFTATLTWTLAPTLSPEDAQGLVRDLLEYNGGCEFPCWWGIVPGQTEWNRARHFFETFATAIEQGGEDQTVRDGQVVYGTNYTIRYEIAPDVKSSFGVGVENGLIIFFITSGYGTQKGSDLQGLLINYGLPDKVWVQTTPYGPTSAPPTLDLIVYYQQKGFWAHFIITGKRVGNILRACPQFIHPRLFLWPTREWTFDDLIQETLGPYVPGAPKYTVLDIKDATSMTIEDFYNIFKNPDNRQCLETPLDLWP